MFGILVDIGSADESRFSKFFNDNRFWRPVVLVGAVQNLPSFDLICANGHVVVILDDPLACKLESLREYAIKNELTLAITDASGRE